MDIKEFKSIINSTLFNKEQKRPQSAAPSRARVAAQAQAKCKQTDH